MTLLLPSQIHYVQDSINNVFDKRSQHARIPIGETLDDLCTKSCSIDDIPSIIVCERNGKYWTGDNRRLWVFREFERLGGCTEIPVRLISHWCIPSEKFTTGNDGTSVNVRRSAGGLWRHKAAGTLRPRNDDDTNNVRQNPPARPTTSGNLFLGLGLYGRSEPLNTLNRHLPSHQQNIVGQRPETNNNLNNLDQFLRRLSVESDAGNPGVVNLDPNNVKYTKESVSPNFTERHVAGSSTVHELVTKLRTGSVYTNQIAPVLVFRVYDDDWVVDGNRRVWAFRQASLYNEQLKIRATIKEDKKEFVEKVRKINKSYLTLMDIITMGDEIDISG